MQRGRKEIQQQCQPIVNNLYYAIVLWVYFNFILAGAIGQIKYEKDDQVDLILCYSTLKLLPNPNHLLKFISGGRTKVSVGQRERNTEKYAR